MTVPQRPTACQTIPSADNPIPGFRPVWRRHIYQFTVLHMVAAGGPVLVRAGQVAKLLTRTKMRNNELLVQR